MGGGKTKGRPSDGARPRGRERASLFVKQTGRVAAPPRAVDAFSRRDAMRHKGSGLNFS